MEKSNEIERIVDDYYDCNSDLLRRRLRALVRKAFDEGVKVGLSNPNEHNYRPMALMFKKRFGFKP